FCVTADARFGSIITLRRGTEKVVIPWRAFKFTDADWARVLELIDILKDVQRIQQLFSSEELPTLWRAIPAFERLQTAWEKKRDDPKYALYAPGIIKGLAKLKKYYCQFDNKPLFVLSVFLHPYLKLDYIAESWGGREEQQEEIAGGVRNARNWRDEAEKVVKKTVRHKFYRT
ncbi:hypothetical protein SISNIDRAFT_420759, partial [Sistotremastrum niveocremeum HHB9708]